MTEMDISGPLEPYQRVNALTEALLAHQLWLREGRPEAGTSLEPMPIGHSSMVPPKQFVFAHYHPMYPPPDTWTSMEELQRMDFNSALRQVDIQLKRDPGFPEDARRASLAYADLKDSLCIGFAQENEHRGRDFTGADLRGAEINNVDFEGAKFTDADLRGTQFNRISLIGVDFSGAQTGTYTPEASEASANPRPKRTKFTHLRNRDTEAWANRPPTFRDAEDAWRFVTGLASNNVATRAFGEVAGAMHAAENAAAKEDDAEIPDPRKPKGSSWADTVGKRGDFGKGGGG